jgi:hypothetical protein
MICMNLNLMKQLIQMIKNKKITWLIGVIALIVFAIATIKTNSPNDQLLIALRAIKTSSGWGYEIAVDGKTFIHQESIPAVEGHKSFTTKAAALLVGNHAVSKLKKGSMPVITIAELKQWGVI